MRGPLCRQLKLFTLLLNIITFFYLYSFAKLELIHMDQLEDKHRSQGERKISGFHLQSTLCTVETSVIGLAAAVLTLEHGTDVS